MSKVSYQWTKQAPLLSLKLKEKLNVKVDNKKITSNNDTLSSATMCILYRIIF